MKLSKIVLLAFVAIVAFVAVAADSDDAYGTQSFDVEAQAGVPEMQAGPTKPGNGNTKPPTGGGGGSSDQYVFECYETPCITVIGTQGSSGGEKCTTCSEVKYSKKSDCEKYKPSGCKCVKKGECDDNCPECKYKRTYEQCKKYDGMCKKKTKTCEIVLKEICTDPEACSSSPCPPVGETEYTPCEKELTFTQPSCCSTKCGAGKKYKRCVKSCEPYPEWSEEDAAALQIVLAKEDPSPYFTMQCEDYEDDFGKFMKIDCNEDKPCYKVEYGECKPKTDAAPLTESSPVECKKKVTCTPSTQTLPNDKFPQCPPYMEEEEGETQVATGGMVVKKCPCNYEPLQETTNSLEEVTDGTIMCKLPCTSCDNGGGNGGDMACLMCKWEGWVDLCDEYGVKKQICKCKKAGDIVATGTGGWTDYKPFPFKFCQALKIDGYQDACQRCGRCKDHECSYGDEVEQPVKPQ